MRRRHAVKQYGQRSRPPGLSPQPFLSSIQCPFFVPGLPDIQWWCQGDAHPSRAGRCQRWRSWRHLSGDFQLNCGSIRRSDIQRDLEHKVCRKRKLLNTGGKLVISTYRPLVKEKSLRHNYGTKILTVVPGMATFEMAAKFWQVTFTYLTHTYIVRTY